MTTYLITNRIACTILGLFEAASEDDAVLAMIRDAGYRDAQHEAEVLDSTVEKLRDELVVTEEDVPAAIAALAHEMVRCYRVCGDDLSAADMIDDNAHHADDWDHVGVAACGVAAGLRPNLVEALWQQYRDDLRDAYVAAWREAVTLDLAARDEVVTVEAAIRLESDLTRHSRQDDGSYIIALDDGDDDALARIAAALPLGWQIDWTGDGNTDADGDSTSDAHVWRDDDAA